MEIKSKNVVLIPVWKRLISQDEFYSLIQCIDVLSDTDIKFICPERIDEIYYSSITRQINPNKNIELIKFENYNFESTFDYSRLLMSKNFYRIFSEYEYMLIYQLDAWIFTNKLQYWCDKGYDYIGAPFCHLCGKCNKNDSLCESNSFVGNGGFSLRKISSFIDKLPIEYTNEMTFSNIFNEDVYIAMIKEMNIPKCSEAREFAFEINAGFFIDKMNGNLPFGFHNLITYDNELYRKLIKLTATRKDIVSK